MRKKSLSNFLVNYWGWLAALLFGVVLAGLVVVRITGPLEYEPILVDGLTTEEMDVGEGLRLNDAVRIEQSFLAVGHVVSHVGVRLANHRGANEEGVVTVSLHQGQGTEVGRAQGRVGDMRQDSVTYFPINAVWQEGDEYYIRLTTAGVESGNSLSVFYEVDSNGFPNGDTRVLREGGEEQRWQEVPGNIRFQIMAKPSKLLIGRWVWFEPAWWAVGGYFLVLLGGLSWQKRGRGKRWLRQPKIKHGRWSVKELLVVSAIGVVLAVTVTLPYFAGLDKITTMGDVQRALVYRGIAREALLSQGDLAAWNPYLCGGEPLLANMESAQLDPFFLLVLIFGENLGARLSVTVTFIIGFLGAYVLARRYGQADKIPSLLAGALFVFTGFQMLAFANGNYAWMPVGWVAWFVYFSLEAISTSKWRRNVFGAALTAAFIFLGGSLHMVMYAVLALTIVVILMAIFYRTAWPLLVLLVIGMVFMALVAVKLWPVAEIEATMGEFLRPKPFIQPWGWLPRMFWDREQLLTPGWKFAETGENFRWIEYGSYIGIVPTVFIAVGVLMAYRRKMLVALAGTALFLLLMTFNEFPALVLRELPFFQGVFRNPQRARSVLMLSLGVLAAFGMTKSIRSRWIQAGIVAFVLLDLATFHTELYPKLFNLYVPLIEPVESFKRHHESYTDFEQNGYYKVSYENYKANIGVVDMCMPYLAQKGVHARGIGSSNPEKPYFGEAMLTSGGHIEEVAVAGDTTRVRFETSEDGWLVLNQNYFPGWQTIPPREVMRYKGLTAARVTVDDRELSFVYDPRGYRVGMVISISACVLGFGGWWVERKRWRRK